MSDILRMLGISSYSSNKEGTGLFIVYLKSGHTLTIKGKATIQRSEKDINLIQIISELGDYEFPVTSVVAVFNDWKESEN